MKNCPKWEGGSYIFTFFIESYLDFQRQKLFKIKKASHSCFKLLERFKLFTIETFVSTSTFCVRTNFDVSQINYYRNIIHEEARILLTIWIIALEIKLVTISGSSRNDKLLWNFRPAKSFYEINSSRSS